MWLAGAAAPAAPVDERIAALQQQIGEIDRDISAAKKAGAQWNDPAVTAMRTEKAALQEKENLLLRAQQASAAGTSLAHSHMRCSHGVSRTPTPTLTAFSLVRSLVLALFLPPLRVHSRPFASRRRSVLRAGTDIRASHIIMCGRSCSTAAR
jgi:hypothetical protein